MLSKKADTSSIVESQKAKPGILEARKRQVKSNAMECKATK